MQQPSEADVMRSVSALVCQFLEVAVHCILFVRAVYPQEVFDRRRMYNVPVRQSRHKELNVYISNALADSRAWMEEGMVESVVVSIEDATSGKQLERFVFEVGLDLTGQHEYGEAGMMLDSEQASKVSTTANHPQQLEDAFRQVLIKIMACECLLKPLGRETSFRIYIHSREGSNMGGALDEWEALESEAGSINASATAQAPSSIIPLKDLRAGILKLQLYAQTPAQQR